MTGRRNRAHAAAKFGKRCLPNWFFPLRPRRSFPQGKSLFDAFTRQIFLHVWLYYGSKNGIQIISNHSKQPQNSVRTSFGCRSICLRKVFACGGRRVVVGADPYKVVQNFRHRILPSPSIFCKFQTWIIHKPPWPVILDTCFIVQSSDNITAKYRLFCLK